MLETFILDAYWYLNNLRKFKTQHITNNGFTVDIEHMLTEVNRKCIKGAICARRVYKVIRRLTKFRENVSNKQPKYIVQETCNKAKKKRKLSHIKPLKCGNLL